MFTLNRLQSKRLLASASAVVAVGLLWGNSMLHAQDQRPAEAQLRRDAGQLPKDWLDNLSLEDRSKLRAIMKGDDRVANHPAQLLGDTVMQMPDHQDQKCCSQLGNAQRQIELYRQQVELLEQKVAALEKGCRK